MRNLFEVIVGSNPAGNQPGGGIRPHVAEGLGYRGNRGFDSAGVALCNGQGRHLLPWVFGTLDL